jgi:hypothetical protein
MLGRRLDWSLLEWERRRALIGVVDGTLSLAICCGDKYGDEHPAKDTACWIRRKDAFRRERDRSSAEFRLLDIDDILSALRNAQAKSRSPKGPRLRNTASGIASQPRLRLTDIAFSLWEPPSE